MKFVRHRSSVFNCTILPCSPLLQKPMYCKKMSHDCIFEFSFSVGALVDGQGANPKKQRNRKMSIQSETLLDREISPTRLVMSLKVLPTHLRLLAPRRNSFLHTILHPLSLFPTPNFLPVLSSNRSDSSKKLAEHASQRFIFLVLFPLSSFPYSVFVWVWGLGLFFSVPALSHLLGGGRGGK